MLATALAAVTIAACPGKPDADWSARSPDVLSNAEQAFTVDLPPGFRLCRSGSTYESVMYEIRRRGVRYVGIYVGAVPYGAGFPQKLDPRDRPGVVRTSADGRVQTLVEASSGIDHVRETMIATDKTDLGDKRMYLIVDVIPGLADERLATAERLAAAVFSR